MIDWLPKRHPEDVPTPVAVAVADFCRRAKAPATPAMVRTALSLLPEALDVEVRRLVDQEPETTPLGPFAVVDMVAFSTDARTACSRQTNGYYESVRSPAKQKAEQFETLAPPTPAPPPVSSRAPDAKAPAPKLSKAARLAEKIAPQKRTAETRPTRQAVAKQVFGTSFLPKRNLPVPRGRFTRIDPSRASYDTLLRTDAKELVASLVEQVPHRIALLRTLDQGYSGLKGAPLDVDQVLNVLDRHQLLDTLKAKERDQVLAALAESRGSLGKAAHGLDMRVEELERVIESVKITREVNELRERVSREALSPRNLALRLELLPRSRYLDDLGITRKFHQVLERDLRKMIEHVRDAVTSVPELVEMLSRQHALPPESLRKALETLGLAETFSSSPDHREKEKPCQSTNTVARLAATNSK